MGQPDRETAHGTWTDEVPAEPAPHGTRTHAAPGESPGAAGSGVAAAPTARGQQRREAIVDAATALFDRKGFHATSMDEIGAAAGISGPGLYRHFDGKDALLTAVFDRIWARISRSMRRAHGRAPREALDVLIAGHVDLAVDDAAALMLLVRELRHVPDWYVRAAARNHERYVGAWVDPLRALHDGLDAELARAHAFAIHGLIDSAALHPRSVEPQRHRRLLHQAARALVATDPRTAGEVAEATAGDAMPAPSATNAVAAPPQ